MRANVWVALTCAAIGCSSKEQAAGGVDGGLPPVADASPSGDVDAEPSSDLPRCEEPGPAIVTDIDATLTTSDNEFLTQLLNAGYDPAERAGGAAMISDYAARGYFVLYLTARPEAAPVGQATAAEATAQWLSDHGYPTDPDRTRLILAPGLVFGASAADFKGGALSDMEDEGFSFAYAYGNATSDIDAYAAAGIDKERTFIIGPEAGTSDTVAVAGEDWLEHTTTFVDPLPAVCTW